MEYMSVAEAREMNGLRLVLSVGSPGPWGISARALFGIRNVPYIPVRQEMGGANEELVAWTGRRNAPVAVYEKEPAVDGWLEIALLAERLGSGPSLFPDAPVERAVAAGFSSEICGRGGVGWSRRQSMQGPTPPPIAADETSPQAVTARQYSIRPDAVPAATARVIGILHGLTAQLQSQRQTGSSYLVGNRLSACDVHWACFSLLIQRLPPEACPLPAHLSDLPAEMRAAIDPVLIEHRDLIWERHIGLPLDY